MENGSTNKRGGSGVRGRSRGRGSSPGRIGRGGGEGSGNALIDKAILEERMRQLQRATTDVKAMIDNLSIMDEDVSNNQSKNKANPHKNTRGCQSMGNLNDFDDAQNSMKQPYYEEPINRKIQDQKYNHNPKVNGHKGNVKGTILNIPNHQGIFPKPPPQTNSFHIPTQHQRPSINRQQRTRGSQSMANISDFSKTQSSMNYPFNKAPTNTNRQENQKFRNEQKVFGYQDQVRGPYINTPQDDGLLPTPPPYTDSFPISPRHSIPSFHRQQHSIFPYSPYNQERAPPYDSSMSNSTSFRKITFTDPPPPYGAPSYPEITKFDRISHNHSTTAQTEMSGNVIEGNISKALSCFRNHFTDTGKLGYHVKMAQKDIIEIVKKREDVFATLNDGDKVIVELCPKIELCADYLTAKGCNSVGTCRQLHLCRYFITDDCRRGDKCQFGHNWETNQNQATLKHFLLDNIDKNILPGLVKKSVAVGLTPRICYYYNKETCRKSDMNCNDLHICFSYVDNVGSCRKNSCKLHHNITAPHCRIMLEKYGISINDSPRDLLLMLTSESKQKSNSKSISNYDGNERMSKNSERTVQREKSYLNNENNGNYKDSYQLPTSTQRKGGTKNIDMSIKSNEYKSSDNLHKTESNEYYPHKDVQNEIKTHCRATTWSTHLQGDVEVIEICLYSMDGVCTNESKGCRYLHCKNRFHWQFQFDDGHWINLRMYQAKAIEDVFCNVFKETVKLHPLDPSRLDNMGKRLFSIMGTSFWIVNFKTMTIVNESNQLKVFKLRRISTRSAAVSESTKATKWEWYFRDEKDTWIKYGTVDSYGNNATISNVTSDEIEKNYLNDSSKPMEFINMSYKYQLDFNSLKQYNLSTGKEREVRRRPAKIYQHNLKNSKDLFPSHWNPMTGSSSYTLVKLSEYSEEYKDIFVNIMRSLPLSKIINIQRLQNPYLWKAFQNKLEEISHYHNKVEMNIQRLFYGANPENITSICKENFDGRIHDAKSKQAFGKGTYFFNSCATAKQRCTKDATGSSYLFVAEVMLGSLTRGNKSDSFPPLNPSTQRRYDTTLDNLEAPTVFVKYDKQEYYPAYIIEIY